MALDAYVVHDLEPEAMLAEILKDPASRVLSAIVFADTYRAKNMKLWIHPNATNPLGWLMRDDLVAPFRSSGRYLPKRSRIAAVWERALLGLARVIRRILTLLAHSRHFAQHTILRQK